MNHIFYQQAFHQQCTIKIHSNDNTSLCFESGTWCLYVHSQLRCIQGEMLVTSVSFIPITVKPTTRVSAVFPYQSRSTQHLVPSMGEGGYWLLITESRHAAQANPRNDTSDTQQDECLSVTQQHDLPQDSLHTSTFKYAFQIVAHPSSSATPSPPPSPSLSQSHSADVTLLQGIFSD